MSGPSRKFRGLTKNAVIRCTIDDLQLQDGILVVSFAHKDNLYQGVLLQLNRERGIPSGISFPKYYFSDQKAENEQNISPAAAPSPPLHERHTYFQEPQNGQNARSLRRIIKTPAKFKNSRMSLRPVQRPVLCAKCGVLCGEKNLPSSSSSSGTSDPDNVKTKVHNSSTIINGRKGHTKLTLGKQTEDKSAEPCPKTDSDDSATLVPLSKTSVDSLDYNYESVRNPGILGNTWQRPLSKPPKNIKPKVVTTKDKSHRRSRKLPASKIHKTNFTECDRYPNASSDDSNTSKNSDYDKKASNLKLCISKLVLQKQSDHEEASKYLVESKDGHKTDNKSDQESFTAQISTLAVPSVKMKFKKHSIPTMQKKSKPYKFRDRSKGSAADNPATFSKRLRSKRASLGVKKSREISCTDDAKSTGDHSPAPLHLEKNSNACDYLTPVLTNEESSDPSMEHAKPPKIKITFGPDRKNALVEFCPKDPGSQEDTKISKAARKAMKRAKKESRKRNSEECVSSGDSLLVQETCGVRLDADLESTIKDGSKSPVEEFSNELDLAIPRNKKRKKEKKKKRNKDHKENSMCKSEMYGESDSMDFVSASYVEQTSSPSPLSIKHETPKASKLYNLGKTKTKRSLSLNKWDDSSTSQIFTDRVETSDSSRSGNSQCPGENHERVCISLKRTKGDSYDVLSHEKHSDLDVDNTLTYNSPMQKIRRLCDAQTDADHLVHSPNYISSYQHFKSGDIVWAKIPDCPWWPGKISFITRNGKNVEAKVRWLSSSYSSVVPFENISNFSLTYKTKYEKARSDTEYRDAVSEAVVQIKDCEDICIDNKLHSKNGESCGEIQSSQISSYSVAENSTDEESGKDICLSNDIHRSMVNEVEGCKNMSFVPGPAKNSVYKCLNTKTEDSLAKCKGSTDIPFADLSTHQYQYKVGSVVGGAYEGHSNWPGKIVDININSTGESKAMIMWYGSKTKSWLSFKDISPFETKSQMPSAEDMSQSYQVAVNLAKEDYGP